MSPTDTELIARVLAHDDRNAFGELVARHQSAVRNFLRHLAHGDTATADDVAQETFLQAYRSLSRFRGDATFSTWLLGIAHNGWRNTWRRAQTASGALPLATEALSPSTAPASDLRHDLAIALRALTDDEQLALHLHYQQGLTHAEIAALLAQPLGTVKTNLLRGREKLRTELAAWNPHA